MIENHTCHYCDESGNCANFPNKLRRSWHSKDIVCIAQIKQGSKPGYWCFFDEDDRVVARAWCERASESWASMERVLAATGISYTLDEKAKSNLSHKLFGIYGINKSYWIGKELRSIKKRQKQLDRISKAAKKLYREMISDGDLWPFIKSVYDAHGMGLSRGPALRSNLAFEVGPVGQALLRLIHIIAHVANDPVWGSQHGEIQMDHEIGELSNFEHLVGRRLPGIFEATFGTKVAISRTKEGIPYGPFLNFVRQTFIELNIANHGKPYTDEAIVRALTVARRSRGRKKVSRQRNKRLVA